jgi:hypothetical protein
MADEQYKWLDRDTAERLLRGEPLEFADADTRDQAGQLAGTLGALSALAAEPPLTSAELPGEANALAAFRKARADGDGERADLAHHGRTHSATSSDGGLVRLGRPVAGRRGPSRWGRPVRFGLAAALTAGMIGGVAVAATTGVLSIGDDDPEPAASVSAGITPLVSPSADPTRGPDSARPDHGRSKDSRGSQDGGGARDGAPGNRSAAPGNGSDDAGYGARSPEWRNGVASACRDVRDGKNLDSGRRRALEEAAHGAARVRQYCAGVLKQSEGRTGSGAKKNGNGNNAGHGNGHGNGNGNEGKDGKGSGDGKGSKGNDDEGGNGHITSGGATGHDRARVLPTSVPPASDFTPAPPGATSAPDVTALPLTPPRSPSRPAVSPRGEGPSSRV